MALNKFRLSGYIPGSIGRITELHSRYYSIHWGFTYRFEAEVAGELSEYLLSFDEGRDFLRIVLAGETIAGSIIIDGSEGDSGSARLRWFIIDEEYRGMGLGQKLIEEAIQFSKEKGYRSIYLWTFRGLEPARKLYERYGFMLTEEYEDSLWGARVVHQKYELKL